MLSKQALFLLNKNLPDYDLKNIPIQHKQTATHKKD